MKSVVSLLVSPACELCSYILHTAIEEINIMLKCPFFLQALLFPVSLYRHLVGEVANSVVVLPLRLYGAAMLSKSVLCTRYP